MKIKKLLSGAMVAAVMSLTVASTANAQKNLRVYDWAGYDEQVYYQSYIKKYKKPPKFSIFAEEEEAKAKMAAGFKIDVVHPCSYNVIRWRKAGLIQGIDTKKLKYYKQINKVYKKLPGVVVGGKAYMIPFEIGQTALVYNADKVPAKDVKSLQVFVNPKYKGKISLPDAGVDWLALGLLATGSRNWKFKNANDPKYKKAVAWLRKVHKNNKFYWTDTATLAAAMKTGEILVAWAWNETPFELQDEGINVKMNLDAKEGFSAFVCGYSWAKASDPRNTQKVYDYLNAVTAPETAKPLVELGYAHANKVGMKRIGKDVLTQSVVANTRKQISRAVFQDPLSDAQLKLMETEFNKVKSGK